MMREMVDTHAIAIDVRIYISFPVKPYIKGFNCAITQ